MKKVFSASFGIPKKKAQIYGEAIQKIANENDGQVKPAVVVNEARDKNSPLHDFFTWDDSIAAEQFRLWQARHLINHIEVMIQYGDEERKTKAFFNVSVSNEDDEKETSYVPVDIVARSADLREQVIARALDEATAWKDRYREYKELEAIFLAIDKTKARGRHIERTIREDRVSV